MGKNVKEQGTSQHSVGNKQLWTIQATLKKVSSVSLKQHACRHNDKEQTSND